MEQSEPAEINTSELPTIMSLDKTPTILPFLLPLLKSHKSSTSAHRPFIVGITGLQGSGKSYLVNSLFTTLSSSPYNYNTVAFSIDDFYYAFETLERLRTTHSTNKLLSHRGEPGTHDVELASRVFESLIEQKATKIPFFDKSRHGGRGDRVKQSEWRVVEP